METDKKDKRTVLLARKTAFGNENTDFLFQMTDLTLLLTESGLETVNLLTNRNDIGLVLINSDLDDYNGYVTTMMLRKLDETIPIILLSNYVNHDSLRLAALTGCTQLIQNPITRTEIEAIVMKYMNEYSECSGNTEGIETIEKHS